MKENFIMKISKRDKASSENFARNFSYSHDSIFQLEDDLEIQKPGHKYIGYHYGSSANFNANLPSLIHQELLSVLQRRRSDNEDTEEDEDTNDDEVFNSSPNETLSSFWANKYNQSQKFRSLGGVDRSRYDLISLQNKQKFNQVDQYGHTGTVDPRPKLSNNLQVLRHDAAKHKISVKPKKNHCQSRKKKVQSNDIHGHNGDLKFVATVNKLCGVENSTLKENSFHVSNMTKALHGSHEKSQNCDISQKSIAKKTKTESEKLGNFLQKIMGNKKSGGKQSVVRSDAVGKSNKSSVIPQPEIKQKRIQTRIKKKPPAPPPPKYNKPELQTMNVKTINCASESGNNNSQQMLDNNMSDVMFLPFSNLPQSGPAENVILKRNASMGCLLSLEESHEKFHHSIQNWSLANEGFLKSLGSLPESHKNLDQSSHISNESLMSSLLGGSSMLDEPELMEETSLVHLPVSLSNNQEQVDKLNDNAEDRLEVFTNQSTDINHQENTKTDDNMSKYLLPLSEVVTVNNNNHYTNEAFIEKGKNINMCQSTDNSDTVDNIHKQQRIQEFIHHKSTTLNEGKQSCKSVDIWETPNSNNDDIENSQTTEPACIHLKRENSTIKETDFAPKYQQEEIEKLLKLADNDRTAQKLNLPSTNVDSEAGANKVHDTQICDHATVSDHDMDYEICSRKKAEHNVSKQFQPHKLENKPSDRDQNNQKLPVTIVSKNHIDDMKENVNRPIPAPRKRFLPSSNMETTNKSVRERSKSFVETVQVPPSPFRVVAMPEAKPIPAPRNFQSFTNVSLLEHQEGSSHYIVDPTNLDEVHVKKIAQRFQESTQQVHVRPTKNSTESSPSSVVNIVAKLNGLSANA